VARGLSFPHPAQAIQVRRRRRPPGTSKWSTETAYAITSLAAHQASHADLVGWMRGHWRIEALHRIRDVTYGEDTSQTRTGNGHRVMATLRNATTGILKISGHQHRCRPPLSRARRHPHPDDARAQPTMTKQDITRL
jgi:hypothetical protein